MKKRKVSNETKKKMSKARKLRVGEKSSNWKGGKIKRKCLICGAIFSRYIGNSGNSGNYCSPACWGIARRGTSCSKKIKEKMSDSTKIQMNRPGIKKRIGKQSKKRWGNPEYRKKMIEAQKAAQNRPEMKKRKSELMKKRLSIPENKRMIYEAQKIAVSNPEHRKRNSERMKKSWQDPEYVEKALKGINKRPTYPEKVFNEMTPDAIRYTGNRAWWRKLDDGKHHNPDFKVTGQDKVIEIYGDYWHRNDDPQELIDLYKQAGLGCLIFWEHEIYNQQEMVLERVDQFIEGSASTCLTKSSRSKVPSPHISNKEIIWKLTGREKDPPERRINRGSKQG